MANDTLPDYDPNDSEARRKAILESCDADRAINEAIGTLHALFALGDMLSKDSIASNLIWTMALGESVRAQADEMRNFLDRPGGWPVLDDEPESDDEVSKIRVLPDSKKLWALDQARDAAQVTVYAIRDLVDAALEINDGDDGRIEEVLEAAKEKLVTLGNDLDSVNFGKRS